MLSARDVLDRLFHGNFDASGLGSNGVEGTGIYAKGTLEGFVDCKFVLHFMLCS